MSQAIERSTLIPSRRAVLAGIAAAPALAAPALALSGPDPIFAAIERHKAAFRVSQETGRIRSSTIDNERAAGYDPVQCKAAIEASGAADDAVDAAADALITIRPTTMAGVLALIRYVEAFNGGAFFLEPWPGRTVRDWQSAPSSSINSGQNIGYAILANVGSALEALAVVS
jgi:hypothetical protein